MKRRSFLKIGLTAGVGVTAGLAGKNSFTNKAQAATLTPQLADPAKQALFTQMAPNALAANFKLKSRYRSRYRKIKYEIEIKQSTQMTGLVNRLGNPVSTAIWGYAGDHDKATWPGKTFEVQSGKPITVEWENELEDAMDSPLPHLLAVDKSLHWCYSLPGYEAINIATDGVPLVPHLHGGHTDSAADGNPEYFSGLTKASRGPRWVSDTYVYDNSQPAGTLWYHDHALGITRLNVYAGLAGFYIIRDQQDTGKHDNPLGLPAAPYELGYVIQDRMFTDKGDLFFPAFEGDPAWNDFIVSEGATPPIPGGPSALAEFFGDFIVVNGKIWPKAHVEPRNYRIRLLNGSDSRFMRLRFRAVTAGQTDFTGTSDPLDFFVIGSDQGLLTQPAQVTEIDFMPGERLDLVFNFSTVPPGARIIIENTLGDSPFGGELPDADDLFPNRRTDRVMAFDVALPLNTGIEDKFNPKMHSGYITNQNDVDVVRRLALFEGKDEFGRLTPMLGTAEPVTDVNGSIVNGAMPWHMPITENPKLGDTEIWEIFNATGDAHPIHVHLVHFDILDRADFTANMIEQPVIQHNGKSAIGFRLENISVSPNVINASNTEAGPKDMVMALPGQVTRIKMTFDKPGRYVWHCHILSHEDHEMMRPLHIGPGPY